MKEKKVLRDWNNRSVNDDKTSFSSELSLELLCNTICPDNGSAVDNLAAVYFIFQRRLLALPHRSSLLYAILSISEPCELSPNTELHWRNSFRLSATLESWINGKGANRENMGAMESHRYYTEARYCSFFLNVFLPSQLFCSHFILYLSSSRLKIEMNLC